MDDFIYQIKLSQIENCSSVRELTVIFKELFKEYTGTNHIFGDGCIHFYDASNTESYNTACTAILVSDLLGNIYNRLIDSKQLSSNDLKLVLSKPFPPIDKEQAIKNLKAFHGID